MEAREIIMSGPVSQLCLSVRQQDIMAMLILIQLGSMLLVDARGKGGAANGGGNGWRGGKTGQLGVSPAHLQFS